MSRKKVTHTNNVGARLREWRIEQKFKVFQLADIIGISQGSMSNLENMKTTPSADTLAAFDRYTNINISWLLTGEGPMIKTEHPHFDESSSRIPDSNLSIDSDLLEEIIRQVEESLTSKDLELRHDKKAKLVSLLYTYFVKIDEKADNKTVEKYLGLMA